MTTAATPSAETRRAPRVNRIVLLGGLIIALPLLAVLVANLGRDPHSVRSPLVGQAAPAFSLTPVGGGSPVALDSLRGKPVVLNFWATWCVPCAEEHPALTQAAQSFPQVQFLGVVYEDDEALSREFLRQRGTTYPTLMDQDGKAAIAFGVFGVPETFFIDAAGRIVEKHVGPLDPGTIMELIGRAQGGAR